MTRHDLHQHLWPERLLAALAQRDFPPRLRRRGVRWELELPGGAVCDVDLADHDPVGRALMAERDGLEVVGIAPSSPLGIEALPAEEAQPLLDAYHEGIVELGAPFRLWAAPAAEGVEALLDGGALGVCVPAGDLGSEAGLSRCSGLLGTLEGRDAALFVHPGPEPATAAPDWWAAMTAYVADMQAAWLAWAMWGRAAHPRLRVLFAMLAGGAPLHAERLAARGGPADAVHDELTYFDVSSYGPRTVDAMLRVVGVDRLVLGSDRPVVEPPGLSGLGPSFAHAVAEANPARLLSSRPIAVAA